MSEASRRKAQALGMSQGKARNKLVKLLLFKMMQQLGEDICFRCEHLIRDADDMSIEHHLSWQEAEDPAGEYFNLDRIGFSHRNCNYSAAHYKALRGHDRSPGR